MEVLTLIKHSLSPEDQNPIYKYFKIGKQIASAGPEMSWRIHQAIRIDDGKEASVFIFEKKIAEKLYKPKRREIVTEILRKDAKFLSELKHPKILRILRPLEECNDSIAFATEPVLGSLANLLGNYERMTSIIPNEMKEHVFLDIELKYGIMQIADVLSYLHTTEHILHNNVCPQNILITKRGMWRLGGFGFAECSKESQMKDTYTICPCSSKQPKMVQPDLDYIAPEIQLQTVKFATSSCDIFSLGMLICSVYNGGKSLIQASHNCSLYAKQMEKMSDLFGEIAGKLPLALVEPTEKMINKDIRYRPTAQLFMLLKFFDDNIVRCVQAVDVFECAKDLSYNSDLFNKISQVLPQCPRKIQFNTFFPVLKEQMLKPEMLILVLPCVVVLSEFCSITDYHQIIMPELKKIFCMSNRPVQATVFLLEKLNIFLAKAIEEDIKTDVLPFVFATIESNSIPGQEAAINVFNTIKKYLDDQSMRKLVLPKAISLFMKSTSVRTKLNALACIDRLLDSLDKMMILDDVLPFLTEINCSDVDIVMSITAIYRHLLSNRMFGLTHSLIATKIMPTLIPFTVCPGLNLDQFSELMEVLFEMLAIIDSQRRTKMINEAPDLKVFDIRSSMDMRQIEKQAQLRVEDSNKRAFSAPGSSRELSLLPCPKSNSMFSNRRHSSFQALILTSQFQPSQMSLDDKKPMMASLPPPFTRQTSIPASSPPPCTPSILVSKPSVNDFKEILSTTPVLWNKNQPGQEENTRSSTHSIGVMEPIRRNSRELLDRLPITNRRTSFHGMCETAMQFFSGKQ